MNDEEEQPYQEDGYILDQDSFEDRVAVDGNADPVALCFFEMSSHLQDSESNPEVD
jgi:hypothetical protein